MKKVQTIMQHLLLLLVGFAWSTSSNAYNFKAENEDGVTIYYNVNNNEAVVTYGNFITREDSYYSGDIKIPTEIVKDGVTIPVTAIGRSAFGNCPSLTSVKIPTSITRIEEHAFDLCPALDNVEIPSSVTEIGLGAFHACTNLKTVVSRIVNPFPVATTTFYTQTKTVLYVPTGTKSLYEATSGWRFEDIIEMSDESVRLTCSNITISKGQTTDFFINLENGETEVIGVQFDLTLPSGVNPTQFEDGKGGQINRERCDNTFTGRITKTDGIITVVIYSSENHVITGGEGSILQLLLKADDNLTSETYQGLLSNIKLVKTDNSKILPANHSFTIIVDGTLKGDVNGDGAVDVQDIDEIAKYITHRPSENFNINAADMDNDDVIDVADITLVVKEIMKQSPANARANLATADISQDGSLILQDLGNGNYGIVLNNNKKYTASQFDVIVPEGTAISDIQRSLRCQGHELSWAKLSEENCYRIIIYSLSNEAFAESNGTLLTFKFDGANDKPALENTLFVGSDHAKTTFGHVDVTSGISTLQMDRTANGHTYTLDGRFVNTASMSNKGVYIIDGKKTIKK